MPMKCSGRSVEEASRVIEIDEVLDAISASLFIFGQSSWKILRLMLSSSVAASMTMSQSEKASKAGANLMRFKAGLMSASLISPFCA